MPGMAAGRTLRLLLALFGLWAAVAANATDVGLAVYERGCIACHGADGTGSLLGVPDLTGPSSRLSQDPALLLRHARDGFRSPGSPMAMPARGGDPALTDAELAAALHYMRSTFAGRPDSTY